MKLIKFLHTYLSSFPGSFFDNMYFVELLLMAIIYMTL